jgi:hypothetical protein
MLAMAKAWGTRRDKLQSAWTWLTEVFIFLDALRSLRFYLGLSEMSIRA